MHVDPRFRLHPYWPLWSYLQLCPVDVYSINLLVLETTTSNRNVRDTLKNVDSLYSNFVHKSTLIIIRNLNVRITAVKNNE